MILHFMAMLEFTQNTSFAMEKKECEHGEEKLMIFIIAEELQSLTFK